MKILVVDGQGGKLGAQVITLLKEKFGKIIEVIAIGTNSIATETMMKAKADICATGENPVAVCSKDADIIIGPIGIVIADSLYGEITPKMALAVSKSKAIKMFIPINKCNNLVFGISDNFIKEALNQIIDYIDKLLNK